MKVAIVGAGITGLAAAYELTRSAREADVFILEAGERAGGKIATSAIAGRPVDEGADAFLARVPWAVELCAELGLDGTLTSPAERAAYVWARGALRKLPDGLVLGVPTDFDALAASGIVSDEAVRRAAADLDLVAAAPAGDESVGELIRRRLGDEVLDRLVDPLLGGINAGDADHLSLRAGAAQLAAAADASGDRSLVVALRAQREAALAADPDAPVFFTLPGGMATLVEALVDAVTHAGVDIRLHRPAANLERDGGRGRWSLGGETVDRVIVTSPAAAAARLLAPVASTAAASLEAIDYASVALVTMAFPSRSIGRALDASGFLVSRAEGLLLTACSWATSKWRHLAVDDTVVLRASAGRFGDDTAMALDDGELVARLQDELVMTMNVTGPPSDVRVSRWPRSFPQYAPGHLDRVAAIEAALRDEAPGVVVAGAALRGLGIPACINQGRGAARSLL